MNCKNCQCRIELCEFTDDDEFYEVCADGTPRYYGYCADCYDNLRSGDLEEQAERIISDAYLYLREATA